MNYILGFIMTKTVPYYAVIFTSIQNEDVNGYPEMAEKMESLAKQQKGFLAIESARNHIGITVSYWESLEAIKTWKQHSEHLLAQQKGRSQWYHWYHVRICKVEREYDFSLS
ncbi:antibiotic biosynthesis monooxygenase family protein [Xanthomarina sp. F2636L]|uniref:antibiotic biosynthesis monooxygenase family protein n=1 Tax=Xanthomarina sp. F2636L TaxID=2996018 RepID=UPI00225DEEB4|nr:antibiotic biosynthesis monooxygenase [Xanthomarina sp. F2636L]MCX7551231.1 antibiotic biosynthesis monooxygenase [Xanthomarina sp. F2636L]